MDSKFQFQFQHRTELEGSKGSLVISKSISQENRTVLSIIQMNK